MYSSFLFILVASVAANDQPNCPDVKPVENFNIEKFGTGVWYEVGRYPHIVERGGNCGSTEYKLENGVIQIINKDVANKKVRSITGTAQLAEDAGNTGKLIYSYPYGASGAITKATFWILATDYNNFAIGYNCGYSEYKKSQQELAWVFSRSKVLKGDVKTAVENFLKETTVIKTSKLVWPDFSDEACKVEE